jgi:hypothetical protein
MDFQGIADCAHHIRKTLDDIINKLKGLSGDEIDAADIKPLIDNFLENMHGFCNQRIKLLLDLNNIEEIYGKKLAGEISAWRGTEKAIDNFSDFLYFTKSGGNFIIDDINRKNIPNLNNSFKTWAKLKDASQKDNMLIVWKDGGMNNNGTYNLGYDALQNQVLNVRVQLDTNGINKNIQSINSLSAQGRAVCGMISLVPVKNARRS